MFNSAPQESILGPRENATATECTSLHYHQVGVTFIAISFYCFYGKDGFKTIVDTLIVYSDSYAFVC